MRSSFAQNVVGGSKEAKEDSNCLPACLNSQPLAISGTSATTKEKPLAPSPLPDDVWCPERIEHLFPELRDSGFRRESITKPLLAEPPRDLIELVMADATVLHGPIFCKAAKNLSYALQQSPVGEHKEVPIQGRSGPLCPSAPCCAITDIANANSCSNPSLKEAAHQSPAPPLPDQQETEAVEKTTAKDSTGGHNSVAILPRALPSQGFSHAALNSQFFSLAGDPSDARQVLGARSATVVLDGSEAKETGVAADESHLQAQQADNTVGSERVNSPEEQTGGCSSQHTATPATFGFNNNNYRGNNESLSSSSPDPPGEMLRLLLAGVPAGVSEAQRSSSSSAAPSSSSCVTSKSSSPFAASREQQQFDLRDFNTATAAVAPRRAEAQAPKPPLSRSGKRQQTVDPLSMLGSVLKSKKTRASSLPELDEQLSVAIAELVETSPELQEIFYYATTDPAAIEVPL